MHLQFQLLFRMIRNVVHGPSKNMLGPEVKLIFLVGFSALIFQLFYLSEG